MLYYAKAPTSAAVEEEIGAKEGEYIRANLPILNSQIPKAEDWHKYEINEIAKTITLSEILELQKKFLLQYPIFPVFVVSVAYNRTLQGTR